MFSLAIERTGQSEVRALSQLQSSSWIEAWHLFIWITAALHLGDIVYPLIRSIKFFLFVWKILVLIDRNLVGFIWRAVDIITAFGRIVFTLKLLYSTWPSLRVIDLRSFVFFQGGRRKVGKSVEKRKSFLSLFWISRNTIDKKNAMTCMNTDIPLGP